MSDTLYAARQYVTVSGHELFGLGLTAAIASFILRARDILFERFMQPESLWPLLIIFVFLFLLGIAAVWIAKIVAANPEAAFTALGVVLGTVVVAGAVAAGGALWTALAPILPIVAAVAALIAALATASQVGWTGPALGGILLAGSAAASFYVGMQGKKDTAAIAATLPNTATTKEATNANPQAVVDRFNARAPR